MSSGGNIGKERRMDEKGMMDGHRGWLKTPSDNAKCKKKASGERRAGGWLTCVAMHQLHLWILPATVVTRCVLCTPYSRLKPTHRRTCMRIAIVWCSSSPRFRDSRSLTQMKL